MSEIASAVLLMPTDLARLPVLESAVSELLDRGPAIVEPEIVRYNLWLAIHELCVNIIQHAYDGAPGEFTIQMRLSDGPLRVEVKTRDQGKHRFDYGTYHAPNLDDPPVNGLGMFLIEQLVDQIEYQANETGSEWRLVKMLQPADSVQSESVQPDAAVKG